MTLPTSSVAASLILDAEWLLDRLPARVRADVVWAAKPIREALARLRSTEPDEEQLARVAQDVVEPFVRLSEALVQAWRDDPESLKGAANNELDEQRARLRAFLVDEDSRDTAEWAFELLRRLSAMAVVRLQDQSDTEPERVDFDQLRGDDGFMALIRGLTALTAAAEEARTGINHSIAADLVDLAFVELNKMAESLSEALEPFADEPRTQRLQRFTRSAERLRTSLTKTEYATLVGAQLHDFDDAPRY